MKKLIIIALAIMTTACYNPPRWLANAYDRADTCQDKEFADDGARLKPKDYQMGSWCGNSNTGPVYVTRGYYSNYPIAKTQAK